MSKKTHNVVATIGEYTDYGDGKTKKRRTVIGALFTNDRGEMSIKFDTMPVGNLWNGWANLFEVERDEE